MFRLLCAWSLRKYELWLFSVKFFVKIFRYVSYGFRVAVDSVNFDMLKITKAKVKAHFLKKFAFVTNNSLAQDAFRKYPRTTENLSNYSGTRIVLCTNFLIIGYRDPWTHISSL